MHVTAHVKAVYDYVPAPPNVVPSARDIELGKARRSKDGGWLMKVSKTFDTSHGNFISEREIVQHTIAAAMPAHPVRLIARGVHLTRTEAVADYLGKVHLSHFEDASITGFETHDDAGPDEALFRELCKPYVGLVCGRTGKVCLTPEDVEDMVAKYMTPADAAAHAKSLHAKFVEVSK